MKTLINKEMLERIVKTAELIVNDAELNYNRFPNYTIKFCDNDFDILDCKPFEVIDYFWADYDEVSDTLTDVIETICNIVGTNALENDFDKRNIYVLKETFDADVGNDIKKSVHLLTTI